MKWNSILTKLTLLVCAGIFIAITIPLAYTSIKTRNIAIRVATEKALTHADAYAHEIKAKFDTVMNISRTLAQTLATQADDTFSMKIGRKEANGILNNILSNNEFMFGIWTCWEPNAFDGRDADFINMPGHDATGRYLPYFNKDESGKISLEQCTAYEKDNEFSDWYRIPEKTKKEFVIPPTEFDAQGKKVVMVSTSVPILYQSRFLGVAGGDITIEWLQTFVDQSVKSEHNEKTISVFANDGTIAAFSNKPENVGKKIKEVAMYKDEYKEMMENIVEGDRNSHLDDNFLTVRTPVFIGNIASPWQLKIDIPRHMVTEEANKIMRNQILIGLVILFIITGGMAFIIRRLVRPLIDLVNATEKITEGNLIHHIDIERNNEIGILAARFRTMIAKFKEVIGEIQGGAAHIVSASVQLSASSQTIAEGASQQAAAIEQMSSSMEQMAANISQNADNAQQTEKIALSAANNIEESKKAVDDTMNAMEKIAKEVSIITEIAKKTDMIAINTSIEASRAGEHGLGFRTVATEVRKLSEKTQKAANRIEQITQSSTHIARTSGKLLEKMVPQIKNTHQLVQEISAASMEQDTGTSQINIAVCQLNDVVHQNAGASQEMAASAKDLASQSEHLIEIVSFFKLEEEKEEDIELSQEAQKLIETFIRKVKKCEIQNKKTRFLNDFMESEAKSAPGIVHEEDHPEIIMDSQDSDNYKDMDENLLEKF